MGNEKSKEQYNLVKSYSVHVLQSKKRKPVLLGEYPRAAKHCVLFADVDYGTPAMDNFPSRTKVYSALLLQMHFSNVTIKTKKKTKKKKRKRKGK